MSSLSLKLFEAGKLGFEPRKLQLQRLATLPICPLTKELPGIHSPLRTAAMPDHLCFTSAVAVDVLQAYHTLGGIRESDPVAETVTAFFLTIWIMPQSY